MDWVFCLDERAAGWFSDMVKAAVVSARAHTTLRPLCLFDGQKTPPIVSWLERQGVTVVRTEVSFREELYSERVLKANEGSPYSPQHAAGAYLRLMSPRFVESDYFLYTDCDVLFLGDPAPLLIEPPVVGACPEYSIASGTLVVSEAFNSGVMYINRAAFAARTPAIIDHARANNYYNRRTGSFDQTILNESLAGRWTAMDARLNWRPFQGMSEDARILHFHGPKPARIRALLDNMATESEVKSFGPLFRPQQEAFRHYLALFEAYLAKADLAPEGR